MNRRDFFRPSRLAGAAGHVLGFLDEFSSETAKPQAAEALLLCFTRRAMATAFEVLLPFDAQDAAAAANDALDEIDRLESLLTVYRDTSALSRLNHLAPHTDVSVEPALFELLELAKTLHEETSGAHDITTGALIKAWGFFRGPPRIPLAEERALALEKCGMQHVVLDATARTVHYQREGVEINLGSIGKGYALDEAAARLRGEWGIRSALLHGGHSSVYAIGSEPGDPRGWRIALKHPWQPERELGVIRLRGQGLGTSAATFRHLLHEGRKLGHILDPRTGWPAEGMASVSVVAPSAALADALATAFFVAGVAAARAYCTAHADIGAVLLPEGRDAQPVTINLALEK